MIRCEKLGRSFPGPQGDIRALDGVEFSIDRGEFVAIRGPSGSGKSTLLLALGGMLRPSQGRVVVQDRDLYSLSAGQRDQWRAQTVGFVFQLFHLLPYLTVRENVLAGTPPSPAHAAAVDPLLDQLGLAHRRHQPAHRLSAGERQRTALARALIKRPELILADEPTGNLDPENAATVRDHLLRFHRAGGTVVVVTHGSDLADAAPRTLELKAGRLTPPTTSFSSPA